MSYNNDGLKLDISTPPQPGIVNRMVWNGQKWVPESVYDSFIHSFSNHPFYAELGNGSDAVLSSFTTPVMSGMYDITVSSTSIGQPQSKFWVKLESPGKEPFAKEFTVIGTDTVTISEATGFLDFQSGAEVDAHFYVDEGNHIKVENFSIRKPVTTTSSE